MFREQLHQPETASRRRFRADPDRVFRRDRVKMLEKTESWSRCREQTRTETALAEIAPSTHRAAVLHPTFNTTGT
jgi:hypothetical protein